MLLFLRLLFFVVLGSMLAMTGWASSRCALFAVPREVFTHPWFLATLLDAYWAFITFYVWVAWKERSAGARILWFVAVILWGNIAMALYLLVELFRVHSSARLSEVVTERRPGRLALPGLLAATGVALYLFAARAS